MDRSYKEKLAEPIWQLFSTLEDDIMSDIIRRIKKTGEITSSADWQINLLYLMGNSSEEIETKIKETLNASYPQIFELYDEVIEKEYTRNKVLYEQINAEFIPYDENEQLKQLTDGFRKQSMEGLSNITQSLGFYLDYGNGRLVYTPLSQVYTGYLDNAVYGIASGAFDYNSVLRKVVRQLTNSGLRSVDYASGYCSRVPVAARRAVMTGISQLTGKISDFNAEKLGTQYFEVAWHANARPAHRVWQGQVWTKEQLSSVCGLGTVAGLLGANCYHEYYPFFPGLSERNWTDEWLDEQNRKEDTPKEFGDKEYTAYEATQKQRSMETAMRAQRQKVRLMQEGGDDPEEIMLARAKYQAQLEEYTKFSKKMELVQQRERIYIDGFGRVSPSNETQTSIANKLKEMYNKSSTLDNIKAYEGDLRGLKKYREKVPDADLYHYRLNKALHEKKLVMPKAYVVPARKKPAYILEDLSHKKDPAHIMKRMKERKITDDQVQEYVDSALFALSHYSDTRLAYYSQRGVTVLTRTSDYDGIEWITKTTWSRNDFDETTDLIIKEAKKYGKS